MANFYDDNEDLRFYLDRGIDWEPLVRISEHDYTREDGFENVGEAVEFYREVLGLCGAFAADEIAPRAAEIDRAHPYKEGDEVLHPPVLQELYDNLDELELYGLCLPRELGGMNAPMTVFQLTTELFARADVSVCAQYGFHGGIAMAALMYSVLEGTTEWDEETFTVTKTRFSEAIEEIITGRAWGSMDITEADAGSDMAKLRCKGEQAEDGSWTVSGTKIFITSGHGRWHFVIARTEKAAEGADAFAGLKGLSMFLVPAYGYDDDGNRVRTHTSIDKVEEKLGHHASATVSIRYDKAPAHLIGERGEGFKYMLMLMNGARVGVGFESLGCCEASYRMALDYAQERPSMGKTIDQHEMIADYLDEMRTDIQAIRCLAVHASVHDEISRKTELRLQYAPPEDAEERDRLERDMKRRSKRARHLTPLLKYFASEKAVEMARRNIQIMGGCGYMTEYGAEKLLRDAMVMPIYEGTSQIQSLMAMKDALGGVVKNPRKFLRQGAQARWRAVSARDPLEKRIAKLQSLQHQTIRFLIQRLLGHKLKELPQHGPSEWQKVLTGWDPKRDFALAMLHAERLTRILIDVAIAEELYEQAKKHTDRRELLERWLERAEPRSRFLHDEITTTGLRLLRTLHGDEELEQAAAK